MAQLVKHPTLAQVMLSVCEFESCISLSIDSAEPTLDLLSPSLSACPLFTFSLKNKHKKKNL